MAHEINTRDGSMHLANGLVLAHNSSYQRILAARIEDLPPPASQRD
ncbi:hypothetical protein [Pararobbsia alpina]|nr:hypothetical protein [Pararobbsia alpina]